MSSAFPSRSTEQQKSAARSSAAAKSSTHDFARLEPPFQLVVAHAGDHIAVHHFLLSVSHQPSAEDFQALLDEPHYDAVDRLLIKRRKQIVAHVHLRGRQLRVDSAAAPAAEFCDVGTLPEYQSRGLTSRLLEAAERHALRGGAAIATVRTRSGDLFGQLGWVPCDSHCFSSAHPHKLLAQTNPQSKPRIDLPHTRRDRLNIRVWRHVDLESLMRLYESALPGSVGPLVRDEPYWQWLVRRRVEDRIYLAVQQPRRSQPTDREQAIGYAAVRRGTIFEIMTDPRFPTVGNRLIAHASADAMEQNQGEVTLCATPNNKLHRLFEMASGTRSRESKVNGFVHMAKILDAASFLRHVAPVLRERINVSRDKPIRPFTLQTETAALLVNLEEDRVTSCPRATTRHVLSVASGGLLQLLLGRTDVARMLSNEELRASSNVMARMAAQLFPRLPFWQPPWDNVPLAC